LAECPRRERREKELGIRHLHLVFDLHRDDIRHPIDTKRPKLFTEWAIASHIEAIPIASALPAIPIGATFRGWPRRIENR
jgi:hypothetical protein